jgi:hypothetical protein
MRASAILVLVVACSSSSKGDLPPPPIGGAGGGGRGGGGRTGTPADAAEETDGSGPGLDDAGEPAPDTGGQPVDVSAPAPDAGADGGALHGSSLCSTSRFAICEGFESNGPGTVPSNWGRRSGYGGRSLGIAGDDSARGTQSLKIEGGLNGSQFIEYKGALGPLATAHYGRIFFKVKTPAPWPTSGVLHGDIVQHLGPHPGGGINNVRWGIVENTQMKFQWIYNVQPTQGEPEFGDGTAYNYAWPGTWQCLEWRYDQAAQTGALWIDGTQIPITVGKSHAPEIPVFTSLGVGWANYQNAPGEGFTVWIDEVAIDPMRIGCDR